MTAMKLALVLALGLLWSCAAASRQHRGPTERPMEETQTFGPSHVVYVR